MNGTGMRWMARGDSHAAPHAGPAAPSDAVGAPWGSDTNVLVAFDAGFDVPHGDGTEGIRGLAD